MLILHKKYDTTPKLFLTPWHIFIILAFVVHKLVGDEIEVYKLNKKPEEGGGYTGKLQVINSFYANFLAP